MTPKNKPTFSQSDLSAGADLWILADAKHSKLLRKIDWFLNFLFFNSSFTRQDKPTLVFAGGKLPTKQVLSVPFHGNLQDWIITVQEQIKKLGNPRSRVFIPKSNTYVEQDIIKIFSTTQVVFEK